MKHVVPACVLGVMLLSCADGGTDGMGHRFPLSLSATVGGYGCCAPASRGELVNTSTSDIPLPTSLSTIYVSAWSGTEPYVPAYTSASYDATGGRWKINTENELFWYEDETKVFYAHANFPVLADPANVASETNPGAFVQNLTPASQTLRYYAQPSVPLQKDILLGTYSGDGGGKGQADIRFYHPLTAVRFIKGSMEHIGKITGITLSGLYKYGQTTQTPTSAASFTWTGCLGDISSSQTNASGLELTSTGLIGSPFLLIPQTLSAKNVKVTVNVVLDDASERVFDATITTGSWESGKISEYALSVDDMTMRISPITLEDWQSGSDNTMSW